MKNVKEEFSSRSDERKDEKDNVGRLEDNCDHADGHEHFEDDEQDNHIPKSYERTDYCDLSRKENQLTVKVNQS